MIALFNVNETRGREIILLGLIILFGGLCKHNVCEYRRDQR